jgi:hypothetical protein
MQTQSGGIQVKTKESNIRHWISFDLGLRGEYESLYSWLDRMEAKECGPNVATFKSDKPRYQLEKEILSIVDSSRKPRIYMINRRDGGKWLIGKRTVSPWIGFGQIESESGAESDE